MTPTELNNSLSNLITQEKLRPEARNEIRKVMQQVELLPYVNAAMRLELCLQVLKKIQTSDDAHII